MTQDEKLAGLTADFAKALFDDGPDSVAKRREAALAIEAVAPGILGQMQACVDAVRLRRSGQRPH